ncbi:phosphoenolpyruvate--protein phosphotransferase [Leptolyngbya sp. NIES-2104]|uniref:phosphoenolpyruvate--protein phosphotransferase n=1 Tax=Leptolyngbya sp. NIES-2104 TaxID=1552121 RepID=UPI0006EC6A25|nr:phosphoenolpyruvate--protein phosphotransferase [Leptolyngbya sp. NIES-2104]GAP95167.1 phosphoenolpyruvate-protein phosphotransferase of PTS system [Leptolyngbya sp. NIES-2104]
MITLDRNHIKLHSNASNKAEAICQAGLLLVENGNMKPDYIDSMMEREKVANTYLGNGIAIPHGLPNDRDLILQTGIAVVQIPQGVEWNPGERVHLVVGIAAKSDEHLEILSNLTHVLDDEQTIQRLSQTANSDDIVACLTNRSSDTSQAIASNSGQSVDVTVSKGAGLHARPATTLVNLAKQFESNIQVRYKNETANAKSLISLLKLGVSGGETIQLIADGVDADTALRSLKTAIESGLEDEAEHTSVQHRSSDLNFETPAISGIMASPGLAIAPIFQFKRSQIIFTETAQDSKSETTRLRQAVETAKQQLQSLYKDVKSRSGNNQAAIFLAHQEFLDDPELIESAVASLHGVSAQLNRGQSAASAWKQSYEQRAQSLEKLSDPLLAGRATDLRDVGERVLRLLADDVQEAPSLPDHSVILIAEDLTPSDTANLDPALIAGFCTAYGGPTSHSAIIARSLDIPAIVGAGPTVLHLSDGTPCVLDGDRGSLYPNPSRQDLAIAETAQRDLQTIREAEKLACYQPALMTDGHRVEVVANIGAAQEAEQAVNAGAEGIGLLRTEFLFLNRTEPPSEEEQFKAYSQMTQALNGLPLIVRTLDIGGDKEVPYLNLPAEANPFLGVRGIRLCLQRPDLFKPQLRAIYRASQTGAIKMMFPMIATLEDLQAAKSIAEEVRLEVGADSIDIGIMIEVPSAVIMAHELAQEVDFFSIGTNDLTQYALAIDRGHPALAKQADGLHPVVLRLIDQTVKAANTAGKWVGVCGGIAGDPKGAAILTGLGVAELSVSIPSVAAIKAKLRSLSFAETQELAKRALQCRSIQEVRAL